MFMQTAKDINGQINRLSGKKKAFNIQTKLNLTPKIASI